MAKIDQLFILVNSLSKPEKRYFKLFCELQEGDKAYLTLYHILEKESHSLEEAKARIAEKLPGVLVEPARKHLYKIVMKSLRSYEADKSVENKLLNLISNSKILFGKGITELCFAEIERAKDLALTYEKFAYYLVLARMELQYLTTLEFRDMNEEAIVAKQEKINEILNHELRINRHSSLYEVLLYRYGHSGVTRSQQENERLNDLLLEEYQVMSNGQNNTFESFKLHLHFQSTYFMMTGNYEESLKVYYELNQLFEENTKLWLDSPIYYIYLLNGILTDLRSIGKYEAMEFFIGRMRDIQLKSDNLSYLIEHLIFQHQLRMQLDWGKFEECLALIEGSEKDLLKRTSSIPANMVATTSFHIAQAYFAANQFKAALKYINQTFQIHEKHISYQLYVLCRLLKLLIHFELSDFDYLNYELRSVERKLKAGKKLFKVEKSTIRFLKKWMNGNRHQSILLTFHKDLSKLREDTYEVQLLKQFDLIPWVEAKIKKMPFAGVVREKKVAL